jgi:hypothetical protein
VEESWQLKSSLVLLPLCQKVLKHALVLGSRGIAFTPISIPSDRFVPESPLRILRDTGRSILWLTTGRTGASFNPRYS